MYNDELFSRTRALLGGDAMQKLRDAHVCVFGVGGVGGYVAEMLARCGVGCITLFDSDRVSLTNRNRQIIALDSTTGMLKTSAMAERLRDINPQIQVFEQPVFYTPENADSYPLTRFNYVADCIDTIQSKIELICRAKAAGVRIISAMGAGNRLDPTKFKVADIYKTSVCGLARRVRYELRRKGIDSLKVVYSDEQPLTPSEQVSDESGSGRTPPASIAFAPAAMGIVIASEIVNDLTT